MPKPRHQGIIVSRSPVALYDKYVGDFVINVTLRQPDGAEVETRLILGLKSGTQWVGPREIPRIGDMVMIRWDYEHCTIRIQTPTPEDAPSVYEGVEVGGTVDDEESWAHRENNMGSSELVNQIRFIRDMFKNDKP